VSGGSVVLERVRSRLQRVCRRPAAGSPDEPALFRRWVEKLRRFPEGSPGARSLRITATKGEDSGGFAYKVLPAGYDRLFLRFYAKFADDYGFCHHFSGMCGSVQPPPVLRGAAGVRPENSWRSLADAEGSCVQNVGIVV
jgi:hypothetical protein